MPLYLMYDLSKIFFRIYFIMSANLGSVKLISMDWTFSLPTYSIKVSHIGFENFRCILACNMCWIADLDSNSIWIQLNSDLRIYGGNEILLIDFLFFILFWKIEYIILIAPLKRFVFSFELKMQCNFKATLVPVNDSDHMALVVLHQTSQFFPQSFLNQKFQLLFLQVCHVLYL